MGGGGLHEFPPTLTPTCLPTHTQFLTPQLAHALLPPKSPPTNENSGKERLVELPPLGRGFALLDELHTLLSDPQSRDEVSRRFAKAALKAAEGGAGGGYGAGRHGEWCGHKREIWESVFHTHSHIHSC
jgi:hypothetical protein